MADEPREPTNRGNNSSTNQQTGVNTQNQQLQPQETVQNQQLQTRDNVLTTGTINIDNGNIDQLYNVESVENFHFHVHTHEQQHQQQIIHQQQMIHQQNFQSINFLADSIANPIQGRNRYAIGANQRKTFDGEKLIHYLKNIKLSFRDPHRNEVEITNEMLLHTPWVVKTTIKKLNLIGKTAAEAGFDRLEALFQAGLPTRLTGVVGEAGSGKSVYMKQMQKHFTNLNYITISLNARDLDPKKVVNFPELMRDTFADYPIPEDDLNSFGEWLYEQRIHLVFLVDGIDEAQFMMKKGVKTINLLTRTTVENWMNLLFMGEIMAGSKVVLTSRPSTIHNLPDDQTPTSLYSLNGFTGNNLTYAVRLYIKDQVNERVDDKVKNITDFINNHGSEENCFLRTPFIVALICLYYKKREMDEDGDITDETTLTKIYSRAFADRKCSIIFHQSENETQEDTREVQQKVDLFYFDLWKNKKSVFTEADIKTHGIELHQLENHSSVYTSTERIASRIPPEDRKLEPGHQSIKEFHSARALARAKDYEAFVEEVAELFTLEDQDHKVMVRRFLSGLINDPVCGKRKTEAFLLKLINVLKTYMADFLHKKYKGKELEKANIFQGYLFDDLAELTNDGDVEFVKRHFQPPSNFQIQIQLTNARTMFGLSHFLKQIKPDLRCLSVCLSEDVAIEHLTKLVDAVPENVLTMHIIDIQLLDQQVSQLKKLFKKIKTRLYLLYDDQIETEQIEKIKDELQDELNEHPPMTTHIEVNHKHHYYLLRHGFYTDVDSELLPLSSSGTSAEQNRTINLIKYQRDETLIISEEDLKHYHYDFLISLEEEINVLTELIGTFPTLKINTIRIFLPREVTRQSMNKFCENLSKMKSQVVEIDIYNALWSCFDFDELKLLLPRVRAKLKLNYVEELTVTKSDQKSFQKKLYSIFWNFKVMNSEIMVTFNGQVIKPSQS